MFVRIAVVAVLGVFLWALFARSSDASGHVQRYRVRAGDTLWSIAQAHYAGDPREAVWKIARRNGLAGSAIAPGQALVLPA